MRIWLLIPIGALLLFSGIGLSSLVYGMHLPNQIGICGFFLQVIGALIALVGIAYYGAKYRIYSRDKYGV